MDKLTSLEYLKSRELWREFQSGLITAAELEERLAEFGDKEVKEIQSEFDLAKNVFEGTVI